MCGLVGFAGVKDKDTMKIFSDLLLVDSVRGKHSTGVFGLSAHHQGVVKKVGLPGELFDSLAYSTLANKANNILIGHNRWATRGKINATNAHPFEFEDVVGVHNGTLVRQSLLPDHADFEVDSENIFHAIQKEGFAETVGKINGAYALVWYDSRDSTLNFSRNDERTLFHCRANTGQFFWASESWMLSGILGRHGVKHSRIKAFKPLKHYKYKLGKGEYGADGDLSQPTVVDAKCYVPPPIVETRVKYLKNAPPTEVVFTVTKPMPPHGRGCLEGETDSGLAVKAYSMPASVGEVVVGDVLSAATSYIPVNNEPMVVSHTTIKRVETVESKPLDHRGNVISMEEFKRRTLTGCAWCADVADKDTIEWLSHSTFLCDACKQDEDIASYIPN